MHTLADSKEKGKSRHHKIDRLKYKKKNLYLHTHEGNYVMNIGLVECNHKKIFGITVNAQFVHVFYS